MVPELTDAVPLDDELPQDHDAQDGDTPSADRPTGDEPANRTGGADDADALRAVADDEDPGDGDSADAAPQRIPKARFDEVNEARKSAQQEAQQLRQLLGQVLGQQQGHAAAAADAPKVRDFDAEYDALVAQYDSGEVDEAQFRRAERKLNLAQAKAEMAAEYEPKLQALQQQREQEQQAAQAAAWTQEIQATLKAYPFLNHEGTDANQDAIAAVRAECEELIAAGIEAPRALRLAVRDVAPQYGNRVAPTPDDVAAARKRKAREAVADAENRQPAPLGGAGNGSRVQGKQRLTASVKDHDKWEGVPEGQREQAFTA